MTTERFNVGTVVSEQELASAIAVFLNLRGRSSLKQVMQTEKTLYVYLRPATSPQR